MALSCKLHLHLYLTVYHLKYSFSSFQLPNNLSMCLTISAPNNNGHLPVSVFLFIPFNCHAPASSCTILFLAFLEHHSVYTLLPQEKLISHYRVNLSFTIFVISFKLHSCCRVHRKANHLLHTSFFQLHSPVSHTHSIVLLDPL